MEMTAPSELLDAVCARDFDRVAGCLTEDATLRAVLPPRFVDATGAADVVGWLRRWFAGAHGFEVLNREAAKVAGRDRLTWQFRVQPHPKTGADGWHVIEQVVFCNVRDGMISGLDLLCSGFRPE